MKSYGCFQILCKLGCEVFLLERLKKLSDTVVLTTVKFVRVKSETISVDLRIPRKRIIAKAKESLMALNKTI